MCSVAMAISSVQTVWRVVMMNRMLQIEKENDRLRKELESRVPKLFMTPQSNYLSYSDGEELDWFVFGQRRLFHAVEDTFESEEMDDNHLNAKIFDGPVSLRIDWKILDMPSQPNLYIPAEAGIVTVKRFIDCVEQGLRQRASEQQIMDMSRKDPMFNGIRVVDDFSRKFGCELVFEFTGA